MRVLFVKTVRTLFAGAVIVFVLCALLHFCNLIKDVFAVAAIHLRSGSSSRTPIVLGFEVGLDKTMILGLVIALLWSIGWGPLKPRGSKKKDEETQGKIK